MKIKLIKEDGTKLEAEYEKYEDLPEEIKEELEKRADMLMKDTDKFLEGIDTINSIFNTGGFFDDIFNFGKLQKTTSDVIINKPKKEVEIPDKSIPFYDLDDEQMPIRIISDIRDSDAEITFIKESKFTSKSGKQGVHYEFCVSADNQTKDYYFCTISVILLKKKSGTEIFVTNVSQSDDYLDDFDNYAEELKNYCNENDWALEILMKLIKSRIDFIKSHGTEQDRVKKMVDKMLSKPKSKKKGMK